MPKAKKVSETPKKVDFQKIAQELLDHIGVTGSVTVETEAELLKFQIQSEEPATLIGYHGETLAAYQRLLGLIIEKQTGQWHKLTVNIGDYRERREETLKKLALSTAQRVKFSGIATPLPPLSPADRRIVHLILSDNEDVYTESEGEGSTRRLVVKPKGK